MNNLEFLIYDTIYNVFGNPLILGGFLIVFFVAFAVALRLSFEALIIALIPAMLFVFDIIPIMSPLKYLAAIGIGIFVGFALLKLIRR